MVLKIWIGKRESDILTYEYFDVSITFWGSNIGSNHSFCTIERLRDNYGVEFKQFVLEKLDNYIKRCDDLEIHFYNNSFAYKIIHENPSLKKYIVNLNKQRIIDIVRHKTLSRVWLQNVVDVPSFAYLAKEECRYDLLINKFSNYKQFVIQKSISGGGNGTYLINSDNWSKINDILEKDDVYLVSPYYENNISLSCHLLIDDKQVVVFPISEQLLNYNDNKISYCGNRYLDTNNNLSNDIKKMATIVGNKLMAIDYRGICGLDFILADNKLMLIEINPRYQGSSYIINAELRNLNLPSLFCLNKMCFNGHLKKEIVSNLNALSISYESHTFTYKTGWTNSTINCPANAKLFSDGVLNANIFSENVYLYRYLLEVPKK